MKSPCHLIYRLALVFACSVPAVAMAQWAWIDNQGRRVFSDQPPPSDIPERNILRRANGKRALLAPAATEPESAPAARSAVKPASGGLDKTLEKKAQAKKEAEEAKQREEKERIDQLKAENCTRARQAMSSLNSGVRIARTNEQGERIFLDEAGIAAETQRVQAIIDSDCAQ